ncbi:sugar isomerase [Muricauda sp. NFXS6]|uniref:sugar isomerase n=1 Tax=Allomuricauda sp. NFXS6 TaxID=2819094 RepID=UPI0032DF578F
MKYLNIEDTKLKDFGALYTAKEISGQPELWEKIFEKLLREKDGISEFLDEALLTSQKIMLTGAGTSAYIGCSVEGLLQRNFGITTLSIPTTHLVSHPQDYFEKARPTLMISFARSGNSPESMAAVSLADSHIDRCFHLIITCSEEGDLANYKSKNKSLVFLLPPDSNDKSLAMTGSYSGMLLTALLIGNYKRLEGQRKIVQAIMDYGNNILGNSVIDEITKMASLDFKRAVFLGSGPLYGTAMESHLKLQELTDGEIVCKNDSYLGFRHGPKAVVDHTTLLIYYFSNKEDVLRYETDLVVGMDVGKKPLGQIGMSVKSIDKIQIDRSIAVGGGDSYDVPEEYLAVCFILFGQLLGFFKSLDLKLQPDSPSKSGAISRVVKGVIIY